MGRGSVETLVGGRGEKPGQRRRRSSHAGAGEEAQSSRADAPTPKETKDLEDSKALAGCRNPSDLHRVWPKLWEGMAPIGRVLLRAVRGNAAFQNLAAACGKEPTRQPPSEEEVRAVRSMIARELGCLVEDFPSKLAETSWQAGLFRSEMQSATLTRPLRNGSTSARPWG